MSDYVREKVLRYPVSKEFYEDHEYKDFDFDYENFFCDKDYHTYIGKQGNYFQLASAEEYFVDFVLEHEYGADSGNWGKVRELYPSEKEKYLPIFQKAIPVVNIDKVRLVEYCWYNCCEPPSYYDLTPKYDKFYDEI